MKKKLPGSDLGVGADTYPPPVSSKRERVEKTVRAQRSYVGVAGVGMGCT